MKRITLRAAFILAVGTMSALGCSSSPPPSVAAAQPVTRPSRDLVDIDPVVVRPATRPSTTRAWVRSDPNQPPLGRPCRVHLRRDALGPPPAAPPGAAAETASGRLLQLRGTLQQLTADWLVIRAEGLVYWVPRDAVLAVEFDDRW